ncbi:rhamnogalacturonan acetylesterase [Chitinophaga horti]|uniref:Rhamnogalacturonan acetylesterase n=1 Tax=Chitinophaga horti TaxID=2920382 RepID=A0ABY6J4K2_9BACT|nr:rhamnogalacturonan acetylesterase [Chitinophaga horti]UYQ94609.1 rhamnogalacturonan acetylesterase [Chitinophaga horti]
MARSTTNLLLAGSLLLLSSFIIPKKKIKVYLAGDSTMAVKEPRAYPETGWGTPFAWFFDSTVTVENYAKNGRSSGTFITEGLWQKIENDLQEGDYVLIQFGHNDEVSTKKSYTTPGQFKANLTRFITATRAKNATPVLITPVSRRRFDSTGVVPETHDYTPYVLEVAAAQKVALIDLDAASRKLYQQFGPETSKLLFLQLQPGEHPNYPGGKDDNTHFSELGARLVAQLVLKDIKALGLELAERVVKR